MKGTYAVSLLVLVIAGAEAQRFSIPDPYITGLSNHTVDDILADVQAAEEESSPERIINGDSTVPGEHPYSCSLWRRYGSSFYFTCGAVVYSENTIMTAAHCVDTAMAEDVLVSCGEYRLTTDGDNGGREERRQMQEIKIHPGWVNSGSQGFPNDLALMQPSSPFVFNDVINTLPIPNPGQTYTRGCKLIGWGVTETGYLSNTLRDVRMWQMLNRWCERRWRGYINDGQVCFLDYSSPTGSKSSSCNGDSGGAARCGDFLVGVTSWGVQGCSGSYYPSVYTRLAEYKSWIEAEAF